MKISVVVFLSVIIQMSPIIYYFDADYPVDRMKREISKCVDDEVGYLMGNNQKNGTAIDVSNETRKFLEKEIKEICNDNVNRKYSKYSSFILLLYTFFYLLPSLFLILKISRNRFLLISNFVKKDKKLAIVFCYLFVLLVDVAGASIVYLFAINHNWL